MGFSPDLQYFYFAVSDEQTVYRYGYDRITGELAHGEPLIEHHGCDGITVDGNGNLWIAPWNGPLV